MNRFIRYFNQNRIRIIITILIVVFIIIIIQVVNYILKQSRTEYQPSNSITIEDTSIPSESVITGEKLPEETTNTNIETIQQFVDYCNNKQYENAYNLLSQDCKDELYNTLDTFINNYCNNIFTTNITYNLELWHHTNSTYTYRIIYYENNLLATGEINSSNNVEDYITVVENEEKNELNINNFVKKETINKTQSSEDGKIEITAINRYMYRDYEKYSVKIKNNTDKTIVISEGENGNDICLVDTNEVEYDSIINELPLVSLELQPGMERTINIRFYKMYNLYRTIDKINFKNIILDKENYEQDKENAQKISISIDI